MKKILSILSFVVLSITGYAQIPDGSLAPNFTATDINGNTWDLYSLLDQGYSVVIDFSATWCGPCWAYHNTHALREVHNLLGQEHGDKVIVFFIEGDPTTTLADLNGTGSNTQGNWVEGTPYPIINENGSIGDAYQITAFPTVFKICASDRKVTEIGQPSGAQIIQTVLTEACTPTNNAADVSLYAETTGFSACSNSEFNLKTTFFNLGTDALSTISFKVFKNETLITTVPWTGNLGTYESTEVDLGYFLMDGTATYKVEAVLANDAVAANNVLTYDVALPPVSTKKDMKFTIKTDNYGYETYWEFRDGAGAVLYSGGNTVVGPNGGGGRIAAATDQGAYGNNAVANVNMSVPENGCYELVVVDDYGDGMCCSYGNGYFKLIEVGTNTTILEGGQYGPHDDRTVDVDQAVNNNEIPGLSELSVYPNPTSDNITLQFSLVQQMPIDINITNTLGQVVATKTDSKSISGLHLVNFNTSSYPNGIYFFNISNGKEQVSGRFTVEK